ncbi:MAG: tudor domain-containing protein [Promethearchaeota archaeon]
MGGLKKGDKIFGRWKSGNVWYPGVILSINDSDNTIHVKYDDGDEEFIKNWSLIQKNKAKKSNKIEKFKKGDRVLGNWKMGNKWYPGKIEVSDTKDKKINIIYDDGDSEWISNFSLVQKDKSYKK